jgi:1,2-diacylglycerol 3-alpha-glucosyltransferase
MRILITTDTFLPAVNGVTTSINNLYKELSSSGHEVKILTLSETGQERVVGNIYYLKSKGINIYPEARVKVPFYNKLINEIIEWGPEVVHSQTEFSTMIEAKHISNRLNIPHIHTYHTMYEDYLGYIFGGKLITRKTAGRAIKLLLNTVDAVVAPTEKTKSALSSYGVRKPIYTIPTGIDLNKFQQELSIEEKLRIKSRLGIKLEDKVITYIGRTAKEKNIDEIITLFKEVVSKLENAKLLIVGAGPELDNLKDLVIKEGLANKVCFTGMVNPEEVYKYYKISEVFVTASNSETQGLTYIEALSSGCPIVCKYDKCLENIILQGKNGFAYKTPWEFSDSIMKLLQNENLRENMSREAVKTAEEYSSTKFKDNILKAYYDLDMFPLRRSNRKIVS